MKNNAALKSDQKINSKEGLSQREIDNKTDLKMYEAFRLIEQTNLLYFRFLKRMNFIIDPKFKHIGAVGYHPKKKKIFVILQENAMLQKTELNYNDVQYKNAVQDIAGLLEHETGHVLYDHIFHVDVKIDSRTKNQAEDFIINDGCHFINSRLKEIQAKDSESILKGGCFYDNIKDVIPELKGVKSEDITSIELYRILKGYNQQQQKQKKQDPRKQEIEKLLHQIEKKIEEQKTSLDSHSVDVQKSLIETQKLLTSRLKKLKMKEALKLSSEAVKGQELVSKTLSKGE